MGKNMLAILMSNNFWSLIQMEFTLYTWMQARKYHTITVHTNECIHSTNVHHMSLGWFIIFNIASSDSFFFHLFFGTRLLTSFRMHNFQVARLRWMPDQQKEQAYETNHWKNKIKYFQKENITKTWPVLW